jgi:hypothetical protein
MKLMQNNSNDVPNIHISLEEVPQEQVTAKKRGRKPKGGKIITKNTEITTVPHVLPNIILHLKCSLQDLNEHNNKISEMVSDPLQYKPVAPPEIMAYNDKKETFSSYDIDKKESTSQIAYKPIEKEEQVICKCCSENTDDKEENYSMKDITNKLKDLRIQFYKNTTNDKKSACFWCTYEFDNPPYYIPKYEVKDEIGGYGSFCRPECAVGYLMKENIDDSTKFERYHLLNRIYSKVSGYTKNIKPAPNPYFLLDKFYGNLSIQEYRKLSGSSHMLLVIDKPLTRILPELHEDNEEFIYNIYGGMNEQNTKSGGMYKVKRQSEKEKGPSKTAIMRNNFGLTN